MYMFLCVEITCYCYIMFTMYYMEHLFIPITQFKFYAHLTK